jgi:hypothetical protein
MISSLMGGPYRLPCRTVSPAVELYRLTLAKSCPAANFWQSQLLYSWWFIAKCAQNTDITEIKQGRQGPALHVQYPCRYPCRYLCPVGKGCLNCLCIFYIYNDTDCRRWVSPKGETSLKKLYKIGYPI